MANIVISSNTREENGFTRDYFFNIYYNSFKHGNTHNIYNNRHNHHNINNIPYIKINV